MEFSKKLQQLPPQFFAALVGKVNAALAEGRDIINLGQGNPDQPTPTHIIDALQVAANNPQTHKYSPFRGITELRQAAADFYKPILWRKKRFGHLPKWPEIEKTIWWQNGFSSLFHGFSERVQFVFLCAQAVAEIEDLFMQGVGNFLFV